MRCGGGHHRGSLGKRIPNRVHKVDAVPTVSGSPYSFDARCCPPAALGIREADKRVLLAEHLLKVDLVHAGIGLDH